MLYSGCQSKSKEISITEKICPQCGNPVELFSTDTEVTCDKCGFVIYNDMLSCVQWCKYARKCVGDQMYEQMMEIAKHNKEKAAKERAEKAAAKDSGCGGFATALAGTYCFFAVRRQTSTAETICTAYKKVPAAALLKTAPPSTPKMNDGPA